MQLTLTLLNLIQSAKPVQLKGKASGRKLMYVLKTAPVKLDNSNVRKQVR